jgi:PAS domain S-box-containing protein
LPGVFFFWEARKQSQEEIRRHFQADAALSLALVQHNIKMHLVDIAGLSRFLAGVEDLSRQKFNAYIGPLVAERTGVQAYVWIRVVPEAEREEFLRRAKQEWGDEYFLKRLDANHVMVPAERHDVYYPVLYLEPNAKSNKAVGFDLGSDSVRLHALEKARDTGLSVVTEKVALARDASKQNGILIISPVYVSGMPLDTVEARRKAIRGFGMGAFRFDDMLRHTVEALHSRHMSLQLWDLSTSKGDELLYSDGDATEGDSAALSWEQSFDLSDSTWRAKVSAMPRYYEKFQTWSHWIILPLGVLISFYISQLFFSTTKVKDYAVRLMLVHTQALREREAYLRSLLDNFPFLVWLKDREGRYLAANALFAQASGRSGESEVVGQLDADIWPTELAKEFREGDERVLATGEKQQQESLLAHQGKKVWLEIFRAPIRDENGELIGSAGYARDVSDRRRVAAEIAQRTQELETLLNGLPGYAFLKDAHARFVTANEALCRVINISRADIAGKTDFDLLPVKEANKYAQDDLRVLSGELPVFNTEDVIVDAGQERIIATRRLGLKGSSGAIVGLIGLGFDITEQKAKDAELKTAYAEMERRVAERTQELYLSNDLLHREILERQQANSDLNVLLSAVSAILIGVDVEGRVHRWNREAARVFNLPVEEAVGQFFSSLELEWDWAQILEGIDRCQDKHAPVKINNLKFKRPDGRDGFLLATISPLATADEEPAGVLILGEEITELKFLEAQLSQAQKLESIGQLAAGVAHEINTPTQYVGDSVVFLKDAYNDLARVLNECESMAQGQDVPPACAKTFSDLLTEIDYEFLKEEIPKSFARVQEGIERVSTIVQAMKRFSHPGGGAKKAVDINQALENALVVTRNEWKYVADVETRFDPELPQVVCLPGDLNQVLLNILINAAHAIGDVVRNTQDKGLITVSTRQDGELVEIAVKDSGTGIPPQARDKIFTPFFTTKEVGKGTGQGLAISYDIVVNKHRGAISFETEEGKGTTFFIRLPIMADPSEGDVET